MTDPRAPEPGEIIDGALSNFINHVRENADVDPQYGVDARHIRDALRRGDLVLASPAPLATTVAPEPTPGAAQRVAQLIEWAERGDLAGVSLDAIRAALYANAPEPTAPDDLQREIAGALHQQACGWNCPGHGTVQAIQDAKYGRWAAAVMDVLARTGYPDALLRKGDVLDNIAAALDGEPGDAP